ncbi:MAG TPA: 23S rRNA (guanosine(2251)-2'-O)-methyltransferase RlmB [Aquella sp.]|nr:23S rRNA (guanosine(2251)-2'-O)-methyltransferase RlmB [Aquella sp.]
MISYIYGFHSVEAAILNSPDSINHILISNSRNDKRLNNFIELIKKNKIELKYVDDLDKLTGTNKHQGVAAAVKKNNTKLEFKELLKNLDAKDNAIVLILDGITDVHNFGAIIRSSNCFGVEAIIVPKNNSANIDNPIVAKVSSGAINTTPVIAVNNLSNIMEQLKEHDFWIAGTALAKNSINLFEFKCNKKIAWVLGNEGSGMRRLVSENCDYLVTIPMQGTTNSLNVSVAAGIILAYTRFTT